MTSEHDSTTTDYTANGLNQYPIASTPDVSQGMRYDVDGNMVESFIAGDMDCDGDVDFDDIDCLVAVLGSCPPNPDPYACDPCDCLNGDMDGDGDVDFDDLDPFIGAMGSSGLRVMYTWTAENRLAGVAPTVPADGDWKVEFAYDYDPYGHTYVESWDAAAGGVRVIRTRSNATFLFVPEVGSMKGGL